VAANVTSETRMTTHGFLGAAGPRPLFASHHLPEGPRARDVAWLLCPPLHLDLIQSYRSMRACAETLARAGFHVLRLDYDGTGESLGATDQDPDRVGGWLESVRRGIDALAAIAGVERVGLLGVRIGGTLALEVSTHVEIGHLVLWEPCSGASYGREMEILASSSPQRVAATTGASGDLRSGAAAAPGVVAGGYWLSEATLQDLARLDVTKMVPRGAPEVLLVQRGDRRPSPLLGAHLQRTSARVTAVQLPGHKEMMVMPQKSAVPTVILEAIRDWAIERSRVVDGAGAAGAGGVNGHERAHGLLPEASAGGTRTHALRFGVADHLFGLLTEPADSAAPARGPVLLLTGGVTPRTSGNGSYVVLAQRLAAKGHAVLRMDASFLGESGTPDGGPGRENDPYPPSLVDDARAGLSRVCQARAASAGGGAGGAWVLGLCSGAYAAHQVALGDPRVRGVILLNPERFQAGDLPSEVEEGGSEGMSTVDQLEQMRRYWQIMRSPESWQKLLSGKADVRHIASVVRARLASRLADTKERVAVRLGRPPKGVARDLEGMLARGVRVHVVFSEGDPGHAAFVTELGPRLSELVRKGLDVRVFPGADHNFHEMSSRAELLDWVASAIEAA